MVKNKAQFLPEWIEFHLGIFNLTPEQGVDRFVIYNNYNYKDSSLIALQPYIDMGIVEWIPWPPIELVQSPRTKQDTQPDANKLMSSVPLLKKRRLEEDSVNQSSQLPIDVTNETNTSFNTNSENDAINKPKSSHVDPNDDEVQERGAYLYDKNYDSSVYGIKYPKIPEKQPNEGTKYRTTNDTRLNRTALNNHELTYDWTGEALPTERKFKDAFQENQFNQLLYHDCMGKDRDMRHKHKHSGCQQSAVLDAVARYRERSTWIAHFDIDEFIFQREVNGTSKNLAKLLRQNEEYDQIIIPGTIFGTNGFLNNPGNAVGLPFPLMSDTYRYRRDSEWIYGEQKQVNVDGVTYTQKGIAKTS